MIVMLIYYINSKSIYSKAVEKKLSTPAAIILLVTS